MSLRPLLINPLLALAVVAAGVVGCRLAGVNSHPRDLLAAAAVCVVAAEAAVALVLWQQDGTTVAVAQTALVALTAHLFLSLALSAVLLLSRQVQPPFVWWALAMYWVTLIGVSAVLIRVVRAAASATLKTGPSPRQGTAGTAVSADAAPAVTRDAAAHQQ